MGIDKYLCVDLTCAHPPVIALMATVAGLVPARATS